MSWFNFKGAEDDYEHDYKNKYVDTTHLTSIITLLIFRPQDYLSAFSIELQLLRKTSPLSSTTDLITFFLGLIYPVGTAGPQFTSLNAMAFDPALDATSRIMRLGL